MTTTVEFETGIPASRATEPATVRSATQPLALAIALITGTATFALSLLGAGRSYTFDESITVANFVDQPLFAPFFRQTVANNHPLFSFAEQMVFKAGFTSEFSMRMLPALFAALTVGIVGWWAARRWDPFAGIASAVVLLAHPMFIGYGQQARGYSLLVLAAVVSTLTLVSMVESPHRLGPRQTIIYVAAAGAGLAAHLYMLPVLAGHLGLVLARRQLSVAWIKRWLGVGTVGLGAYMNAMPARRLGQFDSSFPITAAKELLGANLISVVILGLACAAALWAHRVDGLVALLPLAFIALIWAVMQPFDLYPRLLVFFVPAIAGAAGWITAKHNIALVPVLLGAAVMIPVAAPADSGLRDTAALVDQLVDQGDTACIVGREALASYTAAGTEFRLDAPCAAIFRVGSWNPAGLDGAIERLPTTAILGAVTIHSVAPLELKQP